MVLRHPDVVPAGLLATDDLVQSLPVKRRGILTPRKRVAKIIEEAKAKRATGHRDISLVAPSLVFRSADSQAESASKDRGRGGVVVFKEFVP